eukprot:COSAG02_NODE_1485_length_12370_cov_6.022144_11_plen_109_part_00
MQRNDVGYRLQPVVLEASYTRNGEQRTPLQQAAIDAGCEVIDGRQMLVAQGIAQWEMWTGLVRRGPASPRTSRLRLYTIMLMHLLWLRCVAMIRAGGTHGSDARSGFR